MRSSLEAEVEKRGIPRIEDIRELRLIPATCTDDKIIGLVNRYAQAYGEGIVVYGGIAATEWVYGLKRIRAITSDLDFVCTEAGIEAVLEGEELSYHTKYDILYAVADNVSVSFAFGHIHDWEAGPEFFAAATTSSPFGIPFRCSSREHSIMLKLRRTDERIRLGLPPFGKDALDVLNMIAAPYCGSRGGAIDIGALCDLIAGSISRDGAAIGEALRFVGGYGVHLTAAEAEAIGPAWGELKSRLGVEGPVGIARRKEA